MAAPIPQLLALGRNVRLLREQKKLTQEALGEASELHTSYISDIERGVRNPSFLILLKLAKGLSTEISDLFKEVKP
jgi:transcriptional regulator with XRE-family HTH domain